MLRADVIVVGAGLAGMEAAHAAHAAGASVVAVEKLPVAAAAAGVEVHADAMALDVILSDEGHAAGLVVASQGTWSVQPVRAKAIVLATGGIDALYPGGAHPLATGDGFLLAHRAGAGLADFRPQRAASSVVAIAGGVAADADGATRVPGLFVAGAVAASRAAGKRAGAAAAKRAASVGEPAFGPYAVMPTIDSPLPRGFASLKMDRLRALMGAHFPPEGPRDADAGLAALHRLKGEADEFARARVDVELLSFKHACEVAILLARAGSAR